MPAIGSTGTSLGIRFPDPEHPEARFDIVPDSSGMVHPNSGGMSVSPSIASLPVHAIPRRLKSHYREARGSDTIRIWRIGDGPFADGLVSERLTHRVDPDNAKHGFVEPAILMQAADFVAAIHATREMWTDAEDELS